MPETLAEGEYDVLVTPGDADELGEALVVLCQDAAKRRGLGCAGRERAVAAFSAEVVARQNLEVYDEAISA